MARRWPWVAAPLLLLAAFLAALLTVHPLDYLREGVPPLEGLAVERVRLHEGEIVATVRAGGSAPLQIAQVQVDGAYRLFTQDPPGPIGRLGTARITIPFDWIPGEPHRLLFVTRNGATFEHVIDLALATPEVSAGDLLGYAIVGLCIGFIPVLLGVFFYPALKGVGPHGLAFLLALTLGLLAFLLVDTLQEGLELAAAAAPELHARALVWLSALATLLALLFAGRRAGEAPAGVKLGFFIALGIGLHNLGEGLAVGASLTTGAMALASFLVVGFALHNVTEGIAIASPLVGQRVGAPILVSLAAIAGLPAVLGAWAGAFAYSPHWSAVCFGIAAGAILQVLFEVSAYLLRKSSSDGRTGWATPAVFTGFVCGLALMYGTSLLITA